MNLQINQKYKRNYSYFLLYFFIFQFKTINFHLNTIFLINFDMQNEPQTKVPLTESQPQSQIKQSIENKAEDDVIIDPYRIQNNTGKQIDYDKLITNFGCYHLNQGLFERLQKCSKQPLHRFLKRNIFFSHRDLEIILSAYQKNTNPDFPPFYLYTGRGPSSEALHLGHMLPFIFNKYLQEAFNVPFVIQVTDDEKYFHKEGGDISEFTKLAYQNIKDILALGFDPEKTFIFIDSQYMGTMYPNVCRFQKHINMSTLKAIFGMDFSDNCGKAAYPAIQAAPCLSSSFPHIFGDKNIPCLIPCGIDQDPYFRMTRDVCAKLKAPKPAGLYSKFFPSLQGFATKMSASSPNTGIFLTDNTKQIEKKIKSSISGGRATKQQQQLYGADLTIDIPYHYLTFFLDDDKLLEEIADKYKSGKMLTGQIKKILIKVLQDFVKQHQQKRAKLTDEDVQKFLSTHNRNFKYEIDPQVLKKEAERKELQAQQSLKKKEKQSQQALQKKQKKQKKEKKQKAQQLQKKAQK